MLAADTAWAALDLLPQPLFLLCADGSILAANKIARKQFGLATLPAPLSDLSTSSINLIERSLRLWRRNGCFIGGLMSIVDTQGACHACFGVRLSVHGDQPQILMRAEPKAQSNKQFAQLTQRIARLNREVLLRQQAETQLYAEKERLEVTLNSIGDAVITTDKEGRVTFMNPIAETLTGWAQEEACFRSVEEVFNIVSEDTGKPLENPVQRVLDEEKIWGIARNTRLISRDGTQHCVEDSAAPILAKNGKVQGVIMVFHDVTEAHELNARISYQASHDGLTGLLNRDAFEQRMNGLLGSPELTERHHSLLFLDLDQFKVINDTSGHIAGDTLLRTLGPILASHLRASDTLARLGGDEFAVLLQDCPQDRAAEIAETLRRVISDFSFSWEGKPYNIGVSIGQVNFSDDKHTVVELLKAADSACYVAKDAGRNRVHVCGADDLQFDHRQTQMEWVVRIKEALIEDRFVLYFQPIFPVQNPGSVTLRHHVEILVRLQEPGGQIIAPGVFIPAAERFNLMDKVDQWVVKSVIEHLAQDDFQDIETCAINLSAASLSDLSLVACITELLKLHVVDPRRLCFEVTETAAISNLNHAAQVVSSLKALGCRFALDDFGSGMASFSYLKYLPVDYLKIDGAFVRDIVDDPVDRAMVKAINDVGKALGIHTIAEFVENDAILAELKTIGIDYAQGFGLAKPQPLIARSRRPLPKQSQGNRSQPPRP